MSVLVHDKTFKEPINWTTTFFLGAFHVGAIAALFFFTWKAFAIAFVLWWVAGSLGIGMGYHRLLNTEMGGVLPDDMRDTGSGRWTDCVGGDSSSSSPAYGRGR